MTLERVQYLLGLVRFRDWSFRAMPKGDGFLVQVVFNAACVDSGKMKEHHGRKWYVSSHAVDSEIIQTAWAGVQRAILHEAAEEFYYRDARIYNPHFDVDDLVELARTKREEVRKPQEPQPTFKSTCGDSTCVGVDCWKCTYDDWGASYMRDLGRRKMEE